MEDCVTFISPQIGVHLEPKYMVLCHVLCPVTNPAQPRAIKAMFIYFSLKARVWDRKSPLRFIKIPRMVTLFIQQQKLTKGDQKLENEANNIGLHAPTKNCNSEVWKDCGNGQFVKHSLVVR